MAIPGETLQFTVHAQDPDLPIARDPLQPRARLPGSATIDPVTGQVTWNVPENMGADAVVFAVRATEVAPDGQEALSVVQRIETPVHNYRIELLEAALSELNRERNNDPLQDSQGTQDTLQAVFNSVPRATTIRAVSFASDAAPGSTSVFNRGQLFGPVIGPDTGSGGNSPIQPPEDNSGDKANKRRNEPSREGEQAVPAEQKSSAASNQPEPNLPRPLRPRPKLTIRSQA